MDKFTEATLRSFRRTIQKYGREIYLLKNNGTSFDRYGPVMALVRGYAPDEIIGNVMQGDTRLLIFAESMPAAVTKLEVRKDRVEVSGTVMSVESWDPNSKSIGELGIAIESRCRG